MVDLFKDGVLGRMAPQASGTEPEIDLRAMRRYRLGRVREQMKRLEIPACVLFDPLNIRYASGTSNMQIWTQHAPERYLFLAAEGPAILFDNYVKTLDMSWTGTLDEVRPAIPWFFEERGDRLEDFAARWVNQIADLLREHCGDTRLLATDRLGPAAIEPLAAAGIRLVDAQRPLELARAIKSPEEIACMLEAISVTEAAMARVREAIRPGVTEIALWSLLAQATFEQGGESMETRLLTAGPRTNPWYQECSMRKVRAGELVAFDTDLIGPFGFCVDISRTFFCGPGRPSGEQRRLYSLAHEQVESNIALIAPGMGFRELAEKAWPMPEEFQPCRYGLVAHGVGMADEYPDIPHLLDWEDYGYDGAIAPGMVLCVESYMGLPGGGQGVKLEEQILVTEDGTERLSGFPYEEALLT